MKYKIRNSLLLKNLCKKISRLFYIAMKRCERISEEDKTINALQLKIKNELMEAKNQKKELGFYQDNIISKEEHIRKLYEYITFIGVNFRKKNYDEVDRALRKINL